MAKMYYKNPSYVEGGEGKKWLPVIEDSGNAVETVNVLVMASDNSIVNTRVTIGEETKVVSSTDGVFFNVPYGVEYTVTFEAVEGFSTPDPITHVASVPSRTIIGNYSVFPITTIILEQSIADPSTRVYRKIDGGAIEAIRANSHRYVGTYNEGSYTMSLKQLDDENSNFYADGSDASTDVKIKDVFMKLPQFFYKAEPWRNDTSWAVSFAYGTKPDDTWKEWKGNDLIGAFKGSVADNKLYSVSGAAVNYPPSGVDLRDCVKNRGVSFHLTTWEQHCIMAMLFFAWYCNTDSLAIVGTGVQGTHDTGQTVILGMTDTEASVQGNIQSINFWGLEDWWGNNYELLDNVTMSNGVFTINQLDGMVRIINFDFGSNNSVSGNVLSMVIGENLDMFPTKFSNDYLYYTDRINLYKSASKNGIARTISNSTSDNGVVFLAMNDVGGFSTGRLTYKGKFLIEE